LYTPIIFEAFQGEYERSLAAFTKHVVELFKTTREEI